MLTRNSLALCWIACCTLSSLLAQHAPPPIWQDIDERAIPPAGTRYIVPTKYRTVRLHTESLQHVLAAAPLEDSRIAQRSQTLLDLPMPDGTMKRFRIVESPIMAAELAAKFPDIETYAGMAIDDSTTSVRFDLTPQGFHAMILSPHFSTVYIDPYSFGGKDITHYISYHHSDARAAIDKQFQCYFTGNDIEEERHPVRGTYRFGTCQLRTYRLAVAATGEYTTFQGGTVALAQAAQVTTINRVNGVYEREMAIRMNIVANNNLIIYTNASTDPYTNGTPGTMITENQNNITTVIGSANFDIGHVFGTNSGGLAGLGVVCSNSGKARGVTGSSAPVGDPFDIDYVAHEVGHQFGCNHTFHSTQGACSGNQNNSTAMEPGSGSTIMAYAGICSPHNVQSASNDYFSFISLQEMGAFISSASHTCPTTTALANNAPVIASPTGTVSYNIPISTPFFLRGAASDPDGNAITYCWEQADNQTATMPPVSTSTVGPAFRSFAPTTNPTRYFPNLTALSAGAATTWEVLPSVARTLNFRLTVRDNATGGGCTDDASLSVNTVASAGPFVVTNPTSTGITWAGASNQTVTWNVANTDAAPVSCNLVDILLSTDGGQTYPTVLAAGVPNDGSETILVPNISTTTARVQVVCSSNIFFDISNNNFTITAATSDYTLAASPSAITVCAPSTATITVSVASIGGFSNAVTLATTGLPAGLTASFSPNPITPAANATAILTISNTNTVAAGAYAFSIQGASTNGTKSINATLSIASAASTVTLQSPVDNATNISTRPTFTWSAIAGSNVTYDIQIASDAVFNNIVATATGLTSTTFTQSTALQTNTTYFWRVRANSTCGNGTFGSVFNFTTNNIVCTTFASANVPRTISASGVNTATSTISIPSLNGTITDINVLNLAGTHTWIGDVIVSLNSPANTSRELFHRICNTAATTNFSFNFDDQAIAGAIPCPPNTGGTFQPLNNFAAYNGQNPAGTWTLSVLDSANQDGGTLTSWSLEVCVAQTITTPSCSVTLSSTASQATCNGSCNGFAVATASGANGAVSYVWGNGQTGSTMQGLCAGTYTVTATDANNCTATTSVTIAQPSAITATAQATATTCAGNDGRAYVTASGGTAPYAFAWSNSQTTNIISGLSPNTYTVRASDANGCTVSQSATVTNGCVVTCSLSAIATANNATCNGSCNGFAVATASGANGAVSYVWSNGQTGSTTQGLCAGTYTVTATDANNCTATTSVTIAQPSALTATAQATATTCAGNDGLAYVTASGGTAPYSFAWSNSQTTNIISGLSPNTYTVRVSDANGCTVSQSATVTNGCVVTCSLSAISTANNATCNGSCNGFAVATASGANGAVSYVWSNGQTGSTTQGLCAGTYTVTATDANNCTATTSVTIAQPSAISITNTTTRPLCAGANTGSINITATGNNLNFTFRWSNGRTTEDISGIAAGSYTVTVTDGNGCTATSTITIGQPSQLAATTTSIPTTCNGGGSAAVVGAGGTAPYSYLWSNGQTGSQVSGLTANTYNVRITDANGCFVYTSVTVANGCPCALAITPTLTQPSCNNRCDGAISLQVSGNNGALSYRWNSGQTISSISGICANIYRATITDASGCSAIAGNFVLNNPSVLTSSITTQNATCNGNDGTAFISVTGGVSPYGYAWSSGQSTNTANGIGTGGYSVTITDANGCQMVRTTQIGLTNTLSATNILINNNVTCFGATNGSASIAAAGANNIVYQWDNGETTATATALSSGAHTVLISSAGGCQLTRSVTLNAPAQIIVAMTQTHTPCTPNTGYIAAQATGGTGAGYRYAWSNGASSMIITGLAAGTYTLTVSDGANCSAVSATTISIATPPTLTATHTLPTCAATGSIDLTVSPANAAYTYRWNTGATTQDISGLQGGVYQVEVRDGNCVAMLRDTVQAPPALDINFSVTRPTDNNSQDGSISATASNGTAPFVYAWNTGSTQSVLTGIGVGTYFVTVTDANGCAAVDSIQVGSIVGIHTTTSPVTQFSIAPNPTDGQATLFVTLAQPAAFAIRIQDVLGRVLYESNYDGLQSLQLPLNLTDWAAGTYFVSIQTSQHIRTEKVIRTR